MSLMADGDLFGFHLAGVVELEQHFGIGVQGDDLDHVVEAADGVAADFQDGIARQQATLGGGRAGNDFADDGLDDDAAH